MRMRRIPWAADFLKNNHYVVQAAENVKGTWNDRLKKSEIHLEIGMGKGDYCIEMSKKYPTIGWIGMERNESVAAVAVKKHMQDPSDNLYFMQIDAEHLTNYFSPSEIDVIHLNFSDPWPKKRTAKRRLSSLKYLKMYDEILKNNGEIHMKTDNQNLFEYSLLSISDFGFQLQDVSVDFRKEIHEEDAISEYERKFMEKGQPIYRAVWKRGK